MPARFHFCPACGNALGDSPPGAPQQCTHCHERFYHSPAVGVAVILIEKGKILLGRRRDGTWCIPCGYVQWGESIEDAARREFREETGLDVELTGIAAVHSNFHDPERLSVGIWFHGRRTGGELEAADDLVEVGYFAMDKLPELAFETDRRVMEELATGERH